VTKHDFEVRQRLLEELFGEIGRLAKSERFKHSQIALDAISAVQFWALEETVPPKEFSVQ
jgi:hypothetical protein